MCVLSSFALFFFFASTFATAFATAYFRLAGSRYCVDPGWLLC
jgi:hypothetical protein